MMARAATKSKGTGKISLAPRAKKAKTARKPMILDEKYTGPEPVWEGCERWSNERFRKEKHRGFYYYNYHNTAKDLIPNVIKWMESAGYTKEMVRAYKELPDWETTATIGALATMLLNGMPAEHSAEDQNSVEWLKSKLDEMVSRGKAMLSAKKKEETKTANTYQPTIQERVRDAAFGITDDIETWLDGFITDPSKFDPKGFNVINHFKSREINQAHARVIRDYYAPQAEEFAVATTATKNDDQVLEGYRCYTKQQLKNKQAALGEIIAACNMFLQQAKVNRKPKAKKPVAKEKLVAKVKYKAADDRYKLVSIKPEDAVNCLELWVFNTKTRKLGCYVASDTAALSIKGTSIINFNESTSLAKTVRKPEELLKDVKSLPKTKLRKLYDSINSIETRMNGRINADIVLLKSYS
jgi:hypothetical protein